jgi:Aspartyl protease
LSSLRAHPNKRINNTKELVPVVFALLNIRRGKEKIKRISVLLDSGASSTVISKNIVKKLQVKSASATVWNTAAGPLSTNGKVDLTFTLPELSPSASIKATVHVHDGQLSRYDMHDCRS